MPESLGPHIIGIDRRASEKIGSPTRSEQQEGFYLTDAPQGALRPVTENQTLGIRSGTGAGKNDIFDEPVTRR